VRGRVDQVKGDDLPPALQDRRFKGKVYRLPELVVDVPSLIARLAQQHPRLLIVGDLEAIGVLHPLVAPQLHGAQAQWRHQQAGAAQGAMEVMQGR
jgi:hypothetical protein